MLSTPFQLYVLTGDVRHNNSEIDMTDTYSYSDVDFYDELNIHSAALGLSKARVPGK